MAGLSDLTELYEHAYGRAVRPFAFQRRLAQAPDTDVLIAPTGLGKTAAVTLAWAWRRLTRPHETPRRLIWCLPMRTLVDQTADQARDWMQALRHDFERADQDAPTVHVQMGGAVDSDWRLRPQDAAIIVGTQDMLLSRALMRGYGMSRFGWAIDYGLLHSDCLWVYDEVQLMGPGLTTSAQLEAFRRDPRWRQPNPAKSLWISATLDPQWLKTSDFKRHVGEPVVLRWDDGDAPEPAVVTERLDAAKPLRRADTVLAADDGKKTGAYADQLAREIASAHRKGATTLVILNSVRRAQSVYSALTAHLDPSTERLLLHSRFRLPERRELERRLKDTGKADRIVVATQAIEAGIDMTSAVLITELAPWSSLVQRFGRSNRQGELNASGGADVRWIDVQVEADGALANPYASEELAAAREILLGLKEVSPRALPPAFVPREHEQVIRAKDFEELFDTDPDLSGYDIDISPYVRDADESSMTLFWREIRDTSLAEVVADRPRREELCSAPMAKDVLDWLKRRGAAVYLHRPLSANWASWVRLKFTDRLRPGLVLLLDAGMGGYDPDLGFVGAGSAGRVAPVAEGAKTLPMPAGDDTDLDARADDDRQSYRYAFAVTLEAHLADAADAARELAEALRLPDGEVQALVRAAAWHDVGKAYRPFQILLGRGEHDALLAKSSNRRSSPEAHALATAQGLRRYFRHELASALAFVQQHDGEPDSDLVAFLIAAHHGKVRMGLRPLPDESPKPDTPGARIARGVQDGDLLEAVRCVDEVSQPVSLDLGLMEMGENEHGRRSWSGRTLALLAKYGPFRLALLEALLRMADWRASARVEREVEA